MIKVSVMYLNAPGGKFDHDYYRDRHMPMVKELMGDTLVSYAIDKGLSGGAPDSAPTYAAIGHLISESLEQFQKGFLPNQKAMADDVKNYTDLAVSMQISEIIAG